VPGTHVALIRGINVGRAKRVSMADLRELFVAHGCRDVRTLLNSGNVVFTAGRGSGGPGSDVIERAMRERLGVAARTIVLTRAAYAAAVEENTLLPVASDPARLLVAFCADADRLGKIRALGRSDWSPEALAVGRAAAYAWCAGSILDSPLLRAIGREGGDEITTRNWATVLRIRAALTSEGGAATPALR
jgi:uncharacterized protein (DUF1697 family)